MSLREQRQRLRDLGLSEERIEEIVSVIDEPEDIPDDEVKIYRYEPSGDVQREVQEF